MTIARTALGCSGFLFALLCVAVNGCGSSSTNDNTQGTLNGCTSDMFVDKSASSADRSVNFGGQAGSPSLGYSPKCMTISVGQNVTFNGSFSSHPLRAGTSPSNTTSGSANNPVPGTSSGSTVQVTFPAAGMYTYFCNSHYSSGMTGVVQVR